MKTDTEVQEQPAQTTPAKAKEPTILYVLDSTDGILIPCKTAKGEDALIPLNLLLPLLEKQIARRLRLSGIRG